MSTGLVQLSENHYVSQININPMDTRSVKVRNHHTRQVCTRETIGADRASHWYTKVLLEPETVPWIYALLNIFKSRYSPEARSWMDDRTWVRGQ